MSQQPRTPTRDGVASSGGLGAQVGAWFGQQRVSEKVALKKQRLRSSPSEGGAADSLSLQHSASDKPVVSKQPGSSTRPAHPHCQPMLRRSDAPLASSHSASYLKPPVHSQTSLALPSPKPASWNRLPTQSPPPSTSQRRAATDTKRRTTRPCKSSRSLSSISGPSHRPDNLGGQPKRLIHPAAKSKKPAEPYRSSAPRKALAAPRRITACTSLTPCQSKPSGTNTHRSSSGNAG
mmetsp:Transcript_69561/g.193561  ORF Transcript_69561/g.193561 Transcript_69561/m.193561 type:complete len:235 (+) Transcript_69561:538-1242(+)